jgi:adenylosuccinate synthase
MTERLL